MKTALDLTMGSSDQRAAQRFLSKVAIGDGCWEWQACLNRYGYGLFNFESVAVLAHRFSWLLFRGEIPTGNYLMHRCNNPRCVNPSPKHLMIGTPAQRFLANVETGDGCWKWQRPLSSNGYGRFEFGKSNLGAHKVSWLLFRGAIPDGKHVLHSCDHPWCVRPDHLFLGTHAENMKDMVAKGRARAPIGSSHPCAKLNEAKVIEIRSSYLKSDVSQRELAVKYGVSQRLILKVLHREVWRHVV